MNPLLILLPIVAVTFAVAYGAFRSFGRLWIEHKVRLALLERIQGKPELIEAFPDLRDVVLTGNAANRGGERQSYPLTGVLLGVIGAGCLLAGMALRFGKLAVGIYNGGLICIGLGILLALAGIAIPWFSRHAVLSPPKR